MLHSVFRNVKKFYEYLVEDEALQKKLNERFENYETGNDIEAIIEDFFQKEIIDRSFLFP